MDSRGSDVTQRLNPFDNIPAPLGFSRDASEPEPAAEQELIQARMKPVIGFIEGAASRLGREASGSGFAERLLSSSTRGRSDELPLPDRNLPAPVEPEIPLLACANSTTHLHVALDSGHVNVREAALEAEQPSAKKSKKGRPCLTVGDGPAEEAKQHGDRTSTLGIEACLHARQFKQILHSQKRRGDYRLAKEMWTSSPSSDLYRQYRTSEQAKPD